MLKNQLNRLIKHVVYQAFPLLKKIDEGHYYWELNRCVKKNTTTADPVKLYRPYHITSAKIGQHSYIAQNSWISNTSIGKFCSIGPNLICGWGMHPTNGISTHPMFYSTLKQSGITLSESNKIEELAPVHIGNDVFIGANVVILNGVTIGDGAIIGAGAVVSKDIPPYAIAAGVPIRILRYRFDTHQISELQTIQWWDFNQEDLKKVEKLFFDINAFIDDFSHKTASP